MPLLDHFHAPVFPKHPWESFHVFWASVIGEWLNRTLPRRYIATIHSHLSNRIEADVAEFEDLTEPAEQEVNGKGGVALQTYAPPVAALVLPALFPDDLEIQIKDEEDDLRVVAVVELVSPANKDRPESRRAFGAKCVAYLERGLGLVNIDIVTRHHFHLHSEIVDVMNLPSSFRLPEEQFLSATAYRPARREERNEVDVWPAPLLVGEVLPVVPLALLRGRTIPLDLETTYSLARERSRI